MNHLAIRVLRPSFILALIIGISSCTAGKMARGYTVQTGGDPQRGAQLIHQFGCGACHMIPGIRGANGLVGPPLMSFARRTYVGGEVPNTPENLVHWIESPQSIEPATAMPTLGLNQQQARDVAAYLYTLR